MECRQASVTGAKGIREGMHSRIQVASRDRHILKEPSRGGLHKLLVLDVQHLKQSKDRTRILVCSTYLVRFGGNKGRVSFSSVTHNEKIFEQHFSSSMMSSADSSPNSSSFKRGRNVVTAVQSYLGSSLARATQRELRSKRQ